MRDLDRPVGVLGEGALAGAMSRAVERAGRQPLRCEVASDPAALAPLAERCQVLILAGPVATLPATAEALGKVCDGHHVLLHASRGLLGDALRPASVVLRERTPCRKIGALGGPVGAAALTAGRPCGGVVGSRFAEVTVAVRAALVSPELRLWVTDDLVGVELASCLMGVLAMGAGFARVLGVGASAEGVFLTRGVHEAATIGALWGAQRETFFGLAGFGDLIAAVADDDRAEVQVGRLLGGGMPLLQVQSAVGGTPESIRIGLAVAQRAGRSGIESPVFTALGEIVAGRPASDVIAELMRRERIQE